MKCFSFFVPDGISLRAFEQLLAILPQNILPNFTKTFQIVWSIFAEFLKLSDSCSNFQLTDYSSIHHERTDNKKGGGICIYIHNSLKYNVIHDLSIPNADNETLVI